jgi:hypothetical protein
MSYAMMASEYNDLINQQKATSQSAEESGIADEDQTELMKWKQSADEYSHKFGVMAEGGINELLALEGVKSTFNSFKKSRDRFRKFYGDASTSVGKIDPKNIETSTKSIASNARDTIGNVKSTVSDDISSKLPKNNPYATLDDLGSVPRISAPAARPQVLDPFRSGEKLIPDAPPIDVDIDDLVSRARADTTLGGAEPEAPVRTGQVDSSSGMRFGQTTIDDVGGRTAPPLDLSVGQTLGDFKPIDVQGLGVRRAAPQLEARLGGRPAPARAEEEEEEDEIKPVEPDIPPAQRQTYQTRTRPAQPRETSGSDAVDSAPKTSAVSDAVGDAVGDTVKSVAEKSATTGLEEIGEKFGAGEMLGAIAGPIGEGLATAAGIFTAVDGLVHIFNHSASPVPTVKSIGNLAPEISSSFTSKYASAIPTVDSAHQQSASVMSF